MPKKGGPLWKLIYTCAQELTHRGLTPFTRGDLIACVQRMNPGCKRASIDPMIQGMTDNLRGGAPGGLGRNLLHSVARGRFLLNAPIPSDVSAPGRGATATRGPSSSLEPVSPLVASSAPEARKREAQRSGRTTSAGRDTVDIEAALRRYLGDRIPGARYSSFDYCFNHFQSRREQGRLAALLEGPELELSCLHLGFYLASWGMFRGSSQLLRHSVQQFVPVIKVIGETPASVWQTDVHLYDDESCRDIFNTSQALRLALSNRASDILVTKIMLGTFGCVPAFDTYFKKGFGVWQFSPEVLGEIREFYERHAEAIERGRVHTLDLGTGRPTHRQYTRAKVIDMIFFIQGME